MILKFKALIYRLTGIYLAHKEEREYLRSREFWAEFAKLYKSGNRLSSHNVYSILVGSWQAKHGFHRKSRF